MQTISFTNLSHPTELLLGYLAGFSCCVAVFPTYIDWIKKKQFRQFVREDGPASHASKDQTPTAGGVVFTFLIPMLIPLLWWLYGMDIEVWHLLPLAVGLICGAIGFVDDYAKVASQSNKGISGFIRLGLEVATGLVLGALLVAFNQQIMYVPYAHLFQSLFGGVAPESVNGAFISPWIPHPVFFVLLSGFMVASCSNAYNLHDGMDGLSAGTGCQVFASISACLLLISGVFTQYAVLSACVAGALCAFLVFNRYPAKIFMGDTGSLFIGGLMGALVISSGMVILFIPLSLVYIIEALSVICQVVYYKLTKKMDNEDKLPVFKVVLTKLTKRLPGEGKRLFRMAPIHHHFEVVFQEKGVSEWQVVAMFWVTQALLSIFVVGVTFTLN